MTRIYQQHSLKCKYNTQPYVLIVAVTGFYYWYDFYVSSGWIYLKMSRIDDSPLAVKMELLSCDDIMKEMLPRLGVL